MAGKTEIQRALRVLNFVSERGYDTEYARKKLEEMLPENQELYLDAYCAKYKIREKSGDKTEIQRLREVVRGLQDEVNRYQTIARNAIVMLEEAGSYNRCDEEVLEGLGINETEYYIIMED